MPQVRTGVKQRKLVSLGLENPKQETKFRNSGILHRRIALTILTQTILGVMMV